MLSDDVSADGSRSLDPMSTSPQRSQTSRRAEIVDRLLCASQCCAQGPVFEVMQRIRQRALLRNRADDVHAALLYQAGWFVEWMEGPAAGIDAVLARAKGEPHHRDLRVFHRSSGPRRLTQPWSMAFRQGDERQGLAFGHRVAALTGPGPHHGLEPAALWRRLSMPLEDARHGTRLESDDYQRVMVCSARGTRSFELVRWLGQTYRSPVIHQRLAGSHDAVQDVANDYLDIEAGDGKMLRRVVAMARKGLQIGLFQAFLGDYSHVILLLCGDAGHDRDLVQIVRAACAQLAERPLLLGCGSTGCDHEGLREAARAGGFVYLDCDTPSGDAKAVWSTVEPALDFSRNLRYG